MPGTLARICFTTLLVIVTSPSIDETPSSKEVISAEKPDMPAIG